MSIERVTVDRVMTASADTVWRRIQDVEKYSTYTESVRSVVVTDRQGTTRISDWEVYLRGSILKWTERAEVSDADMTMSFTQITGDLSHLSGTWSVVAKPAVRARLEIEFEIGIPLLARMLTPVAATALRENAMMMLDGVDEESQSGLPLAINRE